MPPSARRARQPPITSLRLVAVTQAASPSLTARPLRWQRSSAASLEIKDGFQSSAESMHRRQQRQAGIGGVDEHDAAVAEHADVVDVDLAGGVRDARHIIAIGAVHGLVGARMFSKRQTWNAVASTRRCASAHNPIARPVPTS